MQSYLTPWLLFQSFYLSTAPEESGYYFPYPLCVSPLLIVTVLFCIGSCILCSLHVEFTLAPISPSSSHLSFKTKYLGDFTDHANILSSFLIPVTVTGDMVVSFHAYCSPYWYPTLQPSCSSDELSFSTMILITHCLMLCRKDLLKT